MTQIAVVCPHCGSTGTYTHYHGQGSGTTQKQCLACRKSFTIEIRNGQVRGVRK